VTVSSTTRVLRLLGPGDPDHLDPASPYYVRPGQLLRAVSRQLFACPATRNAADPSSVFIPVPDAAAGLPALSEDRLTYRIALRTDVWWDSTPPRRVTAHDFVRGFKRIADPRTGGDARDFFIATVRGMRAYCEAFDAELSDRPATAAELARFHGSRELAGVRAAGDDTIVISLTRPANDFLELLATGFVVAVPEEYDRHLASGPYRVAHDAGGELLLERNPVWRQDSDPIRRQDVETIRVRAADEQDPVVRRWIETGETDLAWPFGVVSWEPSSDSQPAFPDSYPGFTLNPYLVLNLRSPNQGGALADVRVRRAIAYAIDKMAIARIFQALEGVAVRAQHSVIAPGSLGHRELNPYPTPGDRGAPDIARSLLAEAGYPDGLTLVAAVRDIGLHLRVIHSVRRDLRACGISLDVRTYSPSEYYRSLLFDPSKARAGVWDIAEPGWTPDWQGNNGRATVAPLLRANFQPGTTNYGGYHNPEVDRLMDAALAEADLGRAADLWHEVDVRVMADVPIIPILAFACRCCAARTAAKGHIG
jgi:peptide/nickel transport system substrate-binding protein